MSTPLPKEQARAYRIFRTAVLRGDLVRPTSCEACGQTPPLTKRGFSRIQGHHHIGYHEPLKVQWLCVKCHSDETPHNPAKGVDQGFAKITPEVVRDIRRSSESKAALGARYGISRGNVGHIKRRRTWAWVEDAST